VAVALAGYGPTVGRAGIKNYRPAVFGLVLLALAVVFVVRGAWSTAAICILVAVGFGRHAWRPPIR
jgi:uncharacterized membrane protein